MTLLQRGITGFFKKNTAISKFSITEFKRIISTAACSLGYTVTNIAESGITPNFHSALLCKDGNAVLVLGHSCDPLIAFAEPLEPQSCQLRFVDSDHLPLRITSLFPDVTVATAAELNRRISNNDLKELDEVELKEIKYWEQQSVGEVIFNWWD